MMACRRLAREAVAASLRRGATAAAPARAFSAAASCSSRAPVAARPVRQFLALYSSPAFQPRAAEFGFGQSLAARAALALRPQLSGRNLLKGFGTSTVLGMALHQGKATAQTKELPSRAITGPSPGSLKNELRSFWPLIRKLQLPIGLIFLIMCGLQSPISLVLNVLLLIYCSRPSRYSIYLFLQELRHRESDRIHWKEESVRTRNVDTKDHKFFSMGTVELTDGRVLHLIGMLGDISSVNGYTRIWDFSDRIRNLDKGNRGIKIVRLTWERNVGKLKHNDMAGRNIGVAVDFSSCSKAALRWASMNLTRDGDKLILIHVKNSYQNEQGAVHLWEQSGSPLIPLAELSNVTKTYGVSLDNETIQILTQVAHQRGVEVFAKVFYGDPAKKLYEAIDLVPLSCMVIGSRGLSTLKRALMGSVSTYIVNHAACPVTVVKENV